MATEVQIMPKEMYRLKKRSNDPQEVFVDLIPLLNRLVNNEYPSYIRVEKRQRTYGVQNYGEILNCMNPSDGDLWDIFLPGYHKPLDKTATYEIEKVFGVLLTPNGNHKIAVSIKELPVDPMVVEADISAFCNEYAKSHRFVCKWIHIQKFDTEEVRNKCAFLQGLFHAYRNNGTWGKKRTKIFSS